MNRLLFAGFRCFLLVAGISVWIFLAEDAPLRFGAVAAPQEPSVWYMISGYFITVVGVFLGSVFRELHELKKLKKKTLDNPVLFIKNVTLSIDLWMGLCAAPLVYALLLKNLGGGGMAGLFTIALENGFCCTLMASQFINAGDNTNSLPQIHD